jgi:hypothetical protein
MASGTSWVKGWKLFLSIPEDTLTGMLRRCLLYGYQIFILESSPLGARSKGAADSAAPLNFIGVPNGI